MNRDDVKEQDPKNSPWDNIFNRVGQMVSELAALRARNRKLVDLLEEIQWAADSGRKARCPACGSLDFNGHKSTCALAAAIKENQT